MKKLEMSDIPNIQKYSFGYRDVNSSDKLNSQQEEMLRDILQLFNKANKIEKEISVSNTMLIVESNYYDRKLVSLQAKIDRLTEEMENNTTEIKQATKTAADAFVEGSIHDAQIDEISGDITPRVSSCVSKTRIYDDAYGVTVVPDQLKVMIGPDSFYKNEHILSVEDNEVNNMFDGNDSTLWIRKIISDSTVSEIENEIIIGLPEDVITTRLINQIVIDPFPAGSIDIQDVMIKNNEAWTRIPEFSLRSDLQEEETSDIFGNDLTKMVLKESGKMRLCFSDISTNQIKIKVKLRNFIKDEQNDQKIWYVGMKNVDVMYNRYSRSESYFCMTYEFKEKNNRIYDVNVILNNESFDSSKASEFNITKEYFYYDENGNTHKIPVAAPFLLNSDKMMVRFTMQPGQKAACVKKCVVLYKTS